MAKFSLEPNRVLIVDDNQKVLDLLVELLKPEGYEVAAASDGAIALDLVASFEPDVVVSDVVMPQVDGIELCRRIKQNPKTATIPVLLMSGSRQTSDDSIEGLTAGADDYLDIPFRHEALLVKVASLIERHRVDKHYREIVEQAADMIYTRTMDGYITSINAAGAGFFNRPVSELIGKHLSELIGAHDAARDIEQTRNTDFNTPTRSLHCFKNEKGEIRYLEGVLTVERDRSGQPLRVRGVVRDITERKLAEDALKESEDRYRRLVELSPDAIVLTVDGKIIYVNRAAQSVWGASSPDELMGRSVIDFVHPDYRALVSKRIQDINELGEPAPLSEQKHVKLNGEVIDVEVTGMPFTFRGQPAVQAVIRDATERKRARESLKQTEARLRTVVGSASLVLFAIDSNGVFTLSEGEGLKSLGLQPGELVGQSVYEVYRHIPDMQEHVRRGLAGEATSATIEIGDLVFDARYSPLTDDKGKVVGLIAVATDVTENRKAEWALRDNEERYRELFENANDIIYTHDLSGNLTSLNRSGERITGYSWVEAARMNIADVIAPEHLELARQAIANKATGKAATVYELDIIAKDGRRVHLEVSTRVIKRGGKAVAVQGIARDLTERKLSEDALRESQAFFNSFMDNSPAIAFMKDDQGRYVYVNKPFEDLFGQKLSVLRGRTSFDWLPAETARQTHEHDLQVLLTGVPQEIMETVPIQDGSLHHWLVFKFPVTDAAGKKFVGGVGVDITERRRAEEALTHQAEREEMTHRISQAVRCSLDSSEIYQTAVRELGSYLNVDRCSLFMKDEKATHAMNVAEYHAEGVEPAATDFDLAELRSLAESLQEKGVLVFDNAQDERIKPLYDSILSKAGVRSIMYVAIRVGDDVPAAFALSTTRQMRNWSESDITLAKAVADQTGIAIRQSMLYQKAEATSIREALVNRLTIAIRASLSLPEVLSTATRELGRALLASRVHLHLYNPENPVSPVEYEFVAPGCSGISESASFHDPIGRYLLGTLQPLVIDDALNYSEGTSEFNGFVRAHAERVGLRSQIDYPVVVKGQFRGFICIHQTDRKRHWTDDEVTLVEAVALRLAIGISQAELFEMVARGKQEWETTFDAMSDGIFIFDRDGYLRRVNQAGAAMERTHPRALQGRKCCHILRTSAEDETCVVERALESQESVTIEITPAGGNRPLLVTIEPIMDSDDRTAAVVCTARDLSELRKVEAVAREHQSLLTHILESARESIYAVDSDGRFKWCNTATVVGLGIKREEFIGSRLLDLVYEGDRELVSEKLKAALNGEAQTYQMRYFSPNGDLRYARVDNSPLVIDGRTTGVLGIARDITEQKEERERAARADKLRALGQLASGVAHDFNNSLAAILGRAQLLRRQTNDDALVRNLDIIQTAAEDAAATVRRIQTFARKAPAKEFDILDVRSLLVDAIEITRTRWENEARLRGLNYRVELDATTGQHTAGSASELREVFVNLIVNAVDAMPQGGTISISCIRDGGKLQLRFTDTGKGMPEDVQQKIFEPFFTTKGAQGTGLGLSVSYSIIERHDGTIRVDSVKGSGTVFTIHLPACEINTGSREEPQLTVAAAPLSILVIDDEESVRETLADMLSALSHKVELAASGQDALAMLASRNFDLVFTDLAMPEMDGWETAREIRKRWPEINILLVTGYGPNTLPPSGEDQLVNGIIGKPFDFAQIINAIAELRGQKPELQNVGA
ncbi:MAG TPA: PAS domain S-box protein [Pyrinomonadaceae bacterium]|nr:PAS domain S-box protein [Pyrinomonadaceae bacterium]